MSALFTICRCATLPEALVVNGLLQAHGLRSSIDNHHHAANAWWLVPALNGVSISLPQREWEEARDLINEHILSGAKSLAQDFGAYDQPRRYGVVAAWYMLLEYTLHIPNLILSFILAGLLSIFAPYIPESWWRPSASGGDAACIPDIRAGSYSSVSDTSFDPAGVLFLIVLMLVFLADRLIQPQTETKEDTL